MRRQEERMTELPEYEHLVQYYETDQMGVVHHSNYIRWFERFTSRISKSEEELSNMGLLISSLSSEKSSKRK